MLLCDVGNTSYHFYENGRDHKEPVTTFDPASVTEPVYYISVNPDTVDALSRLENWTDISPLIAWDKYYDTLGVDRAVLCEALDEGVIIDAGSAITVDIVRAGVFEGGFIYPGVRAMYKSYSDISTRLDYSFNFELDLDKMPKNSRDAISYGYLRTFYSEVMRHEGPIYLTGGYATLFAKIFKDAVVDQLLIFKGMEKILNVKGTSC